MYNTISIAIIITLVYGYLYSTMKEDFGFQTTQSIHTTLHLQQWVQSGTVTFYQKRDAQKRSSCHTNWLFYLSLRRYLVKWRN